MEDREGMVAHIDEFEVVVDVDDRMTMYDYATCRFVHRSPQDEPGWNPALLAQLGGTDHIDKHDENMMMQVRLMDRAINDVGKQQTSKDAAGDDILFSSDFEVYRTSQPLPRRVLPFYLPGETVRGHVYLKLNAPTPARAVQVNLRGQGVVNVKTYDKYAYFDECHRETYIDETFFLWRKTGSQVAEGEEEKWFEGLHCDSPQAGDLLEAGSYRWPFQFRIPTETSQSTPNLLPTSQRSCYVIHRLKGKLEAGTTHGSAIVTHKGLWVEKAHELSALWPDKLVPVTVEEVLDTGVIFKSGHVSVKATLPRTAFVKGEDVPLTLEIANNTSGTIDRVTAYISMHGHFKFYDSKFSASRSINVKSAKKKLSNVSAGMGTKLDWLLAWDFSGCSMDGNLMPTGTLDDCHLIDIKYDVIIKVKRSGLHRDIDLQIPITIGNSYTNKAR